MPEVSNHQLQINLPARVDDFSWTFGAERGYLTYNLRLTAARTSVRAVGSAVQSLTAAVHREAAALADSAGATSLGGIIALSAAGLGLNLEAVDEIDSVTAGTPEWMAPELLATTVPAAWFEPDATGKYVVDTQVPGLREAVSRPGSSSLP